MITREDLQNNALFLSCWYERSRRVQMICFGILIFSILLLSFLNASMQEDSIAKVMEVLFHTIVWVQALVLLIQGTLFASHMGSRERTSEVLDFHRNSPQSVDSKVWGLVFGSTWFEWGIFVAFFVLELPFTLITNVDLFDVLLYNFSILMTGIFFHTSAAAIGLLSTQKKRGSSLIGILLFLWFGAPAFFYVLSASSSNLFVHLFGATAFNYIYPKSDVSLSFSGWIFTFELPLIVMQAIVQIPLFWLMVRGIKRIYQLPNSPAWSKPEVLAFCAFIFLLTTGFFVADYAHIDQILAKDDYRFYPRDAEGFLHHGFGFYAFLYVAIGILISFFSVPSYFKRSKYAVLVRKGLIKEKTFFDDGATGLVTTLSYVLMGGLFMVPYVMTINCTVLYGTVSFLILSSYVLAFAGFLEYYRLGRFRGNKIFFVTALLVWWVVIPWTANILLHNRWSEHIYAAAISPFFGTHYAASLFWGDKSVEPIALMVSCFTAVFMWVLAWQENMAVEKNSAAR